MRILFMGTPDFAVPSLESLVAAGHTVCGVFTQPDKPRNRGMKLQAPPVKVCALAHNIPVYQPVKLRDGAALALIQELAPELIVVAAYGRILPDEILAAPPKGCINVHSSLLPNYRGAAPIHWAVLNGERETGVTIMHMAHDLDAGDIIAQAATPIDPDETVVALHDRLAVLGAELLVNVVADIAAGTATRTPQEHGKATLAPMLSRELSPMDWSRPGPGAPQSGAGADPLARLLSLSWAAIAVKYFPLLYWTPRLPPPPAPFWPPGRREFRWPAAAARYCALTSFRPTAASA